jgi:hypothetical protein
MEAKQKVTKVSPLYIYNRISIVKTTHWLDAENH